MGESGINMVIMCKRSGGGGVDPGMNIIMGSGSLIPISIYIIGFFREFRREIILILGLECHGLLLLVYDFGNVINV